MSATLDRRMMDRALTAARRGRPSPNPHVGAVVAKGDRVISTGHHERAGLAHAEVDAIRKAGDEARGATLYVTFEPCNHHGRTPPCTDAILAAGVARVVIGCRDPVPHVPGAIAKLIEAGLEVEVGVREDEAKRLIACFAKHFTTGLPEVTLKAAVTLDGRMATERGDSKWITGEKARTEAHRLRAYADAVLVGVGTVIADDPELTVRHVKGTDPLRVVLDTHLRTPKDAKLARAGTLILHGPRVSSSARAALERTGVELAQVALDCNGRIDLAQALRLLGGRDVVRLLVEGGPQVHGALLDAGLVDRAAIFVAPRIVGDPRALPLAIGGRVASIAQAARLVAPRIRVLEDDVLFEGEVAPGTALAALKKLAQGAG